MRQPYLRATIGIFLAVLTVACSRSPSTRPTTGDQRVISAAEISSARFSNVYEMVEAIRPLWLRPRGRTSINTRESVKVYLDGSLLGEPEQLRGITTRSIAEIRWLDANEASLRWGLDHGHGAIVISTRRDQRP